MRSMEKCSRPPHQLMAKATRLRSSKMENTISMKTTTFAHFNADCRRGGRSPSGHLVLFITFSRRPLRSSFQDEQEEVNQQWLSTPLDLKCLLCIIYIAKRSSIRVDWLEQTCAFRSSFLQIDDLIRNSTCYHLHGHHDRQKDPCWSRF